MRNVYNCFHCTALVLLLFSVGCSSPPAESGSATAVTQQEKQPATPAMESNKAVVGKESSVYPSAYGAIKVVYAETKDDEICVVTFQSTSGGNRELFTSGFCSKDGLNRLEYVDEVGNQHLPYVAPNGDEFHLFRTLTAGGGNACDGYTHSVVVVRKELVWSSGVGSGCTNFEKVTPSGSDSLVFPTDEGMATVAFGKMVVKK